MIPLKSTEIHGNWATLLLPIAADDAIDFARLEGEIDAIVEYRVNGVYSNGTAGEFYTQTEGEFDQVSRLLAEKCERASLPFQIGVSHTSPQIALDRLRRAKSLRPSAFQVILPDWFPVTDEEAVAFLDRMAAAADPIGLVLYNPPHAKRVLSGGVLRLLSDRVPGIVGAKVGDVDAQWLADLGPALKRLSIFTPGHHLARHLPMGSSGAYSNVACLHPGGAQRWYDLMRRDLPAAQEIQTRLHAFFAGHITPYITRDRYPNAAVDKLLAAIGGWADVGTRLRWPYRWIPADHAAALRDIARRAVPELLP